MEERSVAPVSAFGRRCARLARLPAARRFGMRLAPKLTRRSTASARTDVMSRYATSSWPGGMQPHLLDSTMFWSAAGGGVRRYLLTKRAWLARENGWQHSIVAPGVRGPGFFDCGGWPLPL